jgi:hypothetical protein
VRNFVAWLHAEAKQDAPKNLPRHETAAAAPVRA